MRRILLVLLFLALSVAASVAHAEEVTVEVRATGETALAARSNGLKQAQTQALLKALAARFPDKAADMAARVGPDKAGTLVKNFTVVKESRTAREYTAEIRYEFDGSKLDRLVAEERGLVPEIDSRALLIVPVWQDGTRLMLWEAGNPWREVISRVALEEGRGLLLIPFGDPHDASVLDKAAMLSGERKALVALAERYGTKNLVIAQARNVSEDGKPPHIRVLLRQPGAGKAEDLVTLEYAAEPSTETEAALLVRSAQEMARRLVESTAEYSLFADDEANKLRARVVRAEFRHNREWMQLKRAFEGLPNVQYMEIGAVSPSFAQLTFYFRGSDAMIRQALLTRGIDVQDSREYWIVTLPE